MERAVELYAAVNFFELGVGHRSRDDDRVGEQDRAARAENAMRSSIGFFLFLPFGQTERCLAELGFELVRVQDGQ